MPVNTEHPKFADMQSKWKRCRDVAAGGDAVHAAGEEYLPKLKDQTDPDYKSYKMRASFYNATWRTISGLIGMVFRKPPRIEVPEAIKDLLEDVDGAGVPFQLFVQDVCENGLTVGRVGVLVDYPTAPEGVTQADAKTLNLRPTMQLYRAESIINWRTGKVKNQTVLTLVVLKEVEAVPEDEFKAKNEDRWRVLDIVGGVYRQRVFKRKVPLAQGVQAVVGDFEQVGSDVFPKLTASKFLDYIPFVIMGTDDVSPDVDDPPLIDLVDTNLSHYRTAADYAHGCHFTGLPTLFLSGFKLENPTDKISIGSESAIVTANPDADAKYVEFSGQGLESLEKKLDREEQQMAILGARMLEPQRKQVEAADTASIHRKGEESMLSAAAQAISLGMTMALKWFVEWAGMDSGKVEFELNRDFYPAPMSAQMLTALLGGWQQGAPGLSDQGLFDMLKAGEIVSQETTLEEEQARIAERQQMLMDQQIAAQQALGDAGGGDPGQGAV